MCLAIVEVIPGSGKRWVESNVELEGQPTVNPEDCPSF